MPGDVSDLDEARPCAECGRRLTPGERESLVWLAISTGDDYRMEYFCSQAHASAWLSKPLPPVEPGGTSPRRSVDRVSVGLLVVFVAVVALAMVGLFSLGRLLLP